MPLEKNYQPSAVEAKHYAQWEKNQSFACGLSRSDIPADGAEPYTIVIPPPNVTGSLHMGHALNNKLQDILIRYNRMKGRDALWQPGMDHAGIATQMVVERQLAESEIELDRGRGKSADNKTLINRADSSIRFGSGKLNLVARLCNSFAGWGLRVTGPANALRWMQGFLKQSAMSLLASIKKV